MTRQGGYDIRALIERPPGNTITKAYRKSQNYCLGKRQILKYRGQNGSHNPPKVDEDL